MKQTKPVLVALLVSITWCYSANGYCWGTEWTPNEDRYNWKNADAYCNSIGKRLPTRSELVNFCNSGTPGVVPTGWKADGTWTSTPAGAGSHYAVDLGSRQCSFVDDGDRVGYFVTCR